MTFRSLTGIEIGNILKQVPVKDENDVENKLVEPLLMKLGYSNADWIRQMSVRMGRGERNYPDYAFGATTKRGEERAAMILEVKFSITSQRELSEAFVQAKSYALRLSSSMIILAAKEGIWIFPAKDDSFDLKNVIEKSWDQMNNPDHFHEVKLKISRKEVFGNK